MAALRASVFAEARPKPRLDAEAGECANALDLLTGQRPPRYAPLTTLRNRTITSHIPRTVW